MVLKVKFLPVFVLLVSSLFVLHENAYALFQLSVTPRRGGQDIVFDVSEPGSLLRNEEVTVSVTSDRAVQYMVTQTVYQPLTNEFGDMIPQGAFFVFSPSNPSGTLRVESETPITMGQFPAYTSDAAGTSESFVLVYNVRVPLNQPGGIYRSRITYTLEPVNMTAGASPSVVNLDVRVELRSNFNLTVQNLQGGRTLDFGKITKDRLSAVQTLKLHIDSNIGQSYRILQQLSEPLVSQTGETLDESAVRFVTTGGEQGTPVGKSGTGTLGLSQAALYTSDTRGSGDAFQVQYTITPAQTQSAGIYTGTLVLKADSGSPLVSPQIFTLPVRLEIEPIFYLDVTMEEPSNIHFGTFRSGQEKVMKTVELTMHSNLGAPYQISQVLSRKLTNEEGAVIPQENFLYFGSDAQTGLLAAMSLVPVKEGESVVFTSDSRGTPQAFKLNYSLTVPKGSKAGSYQTNLRYSVTTL